MKILREKGPAYLEKDLKGAKNDFEVRRGNLSSMHAGTPLCCGGRRPCVVTSTWLSAPRIHSSPPLRRTSRGEERLRGVPGGTPARCETVCTLGRTQAVGVLCSLLTYAVTSSWLGAGFGLSVRTFRICVLCSLSAPLSPSGGTVAGDGSLAVPFTGSAPTLAVTVRGGCAARRRPVSDPVDIGSADDTKSNGLGAKTEDKVLTYTYIGCAV